MTQLFSIRPNPPCRGQDLLISWGGSLPAHITATFNPPGTSTQYTLTSATKTVPVPAGAITLNLADDDGNSDDLSSPCVNCG